MDIHLVVDNYATHKHPKVRTWLARRPRGHIHFTPTYASWLNQVERFFALITQRAIRRGSFDSTADLVKKNRPLYPHPQCRCSPLRLDRNCRLHSPETRATLSANLRDRTLETSCSWRLE
ncbi:hypothetical protein CK489_13785 [Bradyrhizobium sp. UFLA03-84]|nr:hypothetical protein CK489_13785 [Bradyrhizobium sp. UFLA03-84]